MNIHTFHDSIECIQRVHEILLVHARAPSSRINNHPFAKAVNIIAASQIGTNKFRLFGVGNMIERASQFSDQLEIQGKQSNRCLYTFGCVNRKSISGVFERSTGAESGSH
ncbi:hypothetical protein Zmor_027699 [Zophobas morio]|uniref:Uncharacterized protein n=1 Tax=Zophobas morio TaxID=2755281 RepID=A0AA38M3A1_9CUCU|nr:hypothetical protein Zmor_027699 [Zophobas morio]